MDNILTVACDEPGGVQLRTVRQLLPDPVRVLEVYDKLRCCPSMFEHDKGAPRSIESMLRDWWKYYLVDDVGLMCFDPFQPGKAHVHITFWDRRLRGRERLCRETALLLMREMGVELVLTAVPLSSRVVRAFAKRVGFRHWRELNGREVLVADAGCFTTKQPGVN